MIKFKKSPNRNIEKFILENIEDPIVVVSFDQEILYMNNSAKELDVLIGRKYFLDLITYPLTLPSIKENLSTKNIFKEINNNHFLIDAFPFQDEGLILLIKDITRFAELENKAKREGIIFTVFKFLSEIFHDMKGPVGGIKGSAQLLKEDPEDTELIDDILYETQRLENLINEITLISKPLNLKLKVENIHKIIDKSIYSFEKQYPNVKFERYYDPSLPDIMVDKEQLLRVFTNIIRNAIEAIEGKGKITIKTGISWDKIYSPRGNNIFVQIKDSGKGVPEEMVDKLFLPFSSTKKNGMGIGLSSSYKIIKEHQGILRYIGDSTFEIILPIKQ